MKKRLFMLLALTMAASLAACGAGASGEPQESQPGNSSSSASQPLTPAEPDTMPDSSQEPSKGNANSTLVAYFSATDNARPAITGSLMRGIFAIAVSAVILSKLLGINGVWGSFLSSEVITFAVLLLLSRFQKKPQKEIK